MENQESVLNKNPRDSSTMQKKRSIGKQKKLVNQEHIIEGETPEVLESYDTPTAIACYSNTTTNSNIDGKEQPDNGLSSYVTEDALGSDDIPSQDGYE
eukprot:UN04341